MHVLRLFATAGPDGILRLNVPVEAAGAYEVAVVVAPNSSANGTPTTPKTPEELGWPPGYFENTYGSIDDDAFVAPPRTSIKPITPLDLE